MPAGTTRGQGAVLIPSTMTTEEKEEAMDQILDAFGDLSPTEREQLIEDLMRHHRKLKEVGR